MVTFSLSARKRLQWNDTAEAKKVNGIFVKRNRDAKEYWTEEKRERNLNVEFAEACFRA